LVTLTRNAGSDEIFDGTKIEALSKFCAAGFTALAAILAFFGIQGGGVDQILAQDATGALWVFVCLGWGVVSSMFAAAVNSKWLIQAWIPFVLVLMQAAFTRYMVDPLVESRRAPTVLFLVLVAIGLVTCIYLGLTNRLIAVNAVLLAAAVVSTSIGLYSATKLSVASKAESGVLAVRGSEGNDASRSTFVITLKGSRLQPGDRRVELRGVADAQNEDASAVLIGVATVRPDNAGEVNESLTYPIELTSWEFLTVRVCEAADCATQPPVVRYPGSRLFRVPSGAGRLVRTRSGLRASVTLSRLTHDRLVTVVVGRGTRSKPVSFLLERVAPDANGTVRWSADVPQAGRGKWVVVRVRVCKTRCTRKDIWTRVAESKFTG
jgi:hypothetical protein